MISVIIRGISRQCFVMVLSLTLGTHLAAINGGIVLSFTTIHFSINVQAARLVSWCFYEICNICDECVHNHSLKMFGNEEKDMVVVFVEAPSTKQHEL
jgi:hypothetical protein